MRSAILILTMCFAPIAGFAAEDTGERTYPEDDRSACMDRAVDSARGGCVTREDGSMRAAAPQQLPPEPDSTRQSPPESTGTDRGEVPAASSGER